MNLMSGSTLHQKILSVGKDPMIEDGKRVPAAHLELYDQQPGEEQQALTFNVLQKLPATDGNEGTTGGTGVRGCVNRPN